MYYVRPRVFLRVTGFRPSAKNQPQNQSYIPFYFKYCSSKDTHVTHEQWNIFQRVLDEKWLWSICEDEEDLKTTKEIKIENGYGGKLPKQKNE